MPQLNLLTLLSAIATAEGFFVDATIPNKCNNPGDLRYAGQDGSTPSKFGTPIPFAQFDSVGRGTAANLRQLCRTIQSGATLRTLIYGWAPPTDGNDTSNYLNETIRRIKSKDGLDIDPDVKLWDYLKLDRIA